MSNFPFPGPKLLLNDAHGTGLYILGDAHVSTVSAWTVQVVDVDSLSVSITVKARADNQAAGSDGDDIAFVAVPYRKLWLNGAAGDGSIVTTAITDASLIIIPSDGMQIGLDVTFTSGVGAIYATPRSGPSVI